MERKCRILWLDDDFSTTSDKCRTMKMHESHIRKEFAEKGVDVEIKTCVYVNDFVTMACDNNYTWDVFILDINGKEDENSLVDDPRDFMYKICKKTKSCDVLRFCLTGQPRLDPQSNTDKETLYDILEDYHFIPDTEQNLPYWWKNGRIIDMAARIIELYNDEFGGYHQLRKLCDYMNEGDKAYIRQLAKWKLTDGDEPFPDHLSLRTAIKDGVLNNALPNIFFSGSEHNFNYFGENSKTKLKKKAIEDWQRFPISFLTVLNKECHSNKKFVTKLLNEMIFNSVIIFAEWLFDFLEKLKKASLEEYVNLPQTEAVPKEQSLESSSTGICGKIGIGNKILYIDNCIIPSYLLAKSVNKTVSSIEVVENTKNPDTKNNFFYPLKATKIRFKNK